MIRDLFPYISLVLKVNLSSYLDMVPSSSADNVTTRVARMLSWGMKRRAKPLGLPIWVKSSSHEWLFREPPEISETGSDIYYLGNKAYIGKKGYIANKEFRTISVT